MRVYTPDLPTGVSVRGVYIHVLVSAAAAGPLLVVSSGGMLARVCVQYLLTHCS